MCFAIDRRMIAFSPLLINLLQLDFAILDPYVYRSHPSIHTCAESDFERISTETPWTLIQTNF